MKYLTEEEQQIHKEQERVKRERQQQCPAVATPTVASDNLTAERKKHEQENPTTVNYSDFTDISDVDARIAAIRRMKDLQRTLQKFGEIIRRNDRIIASSKMWCLERQDYITRVANLTEDVDYKPLEDINGNVEAAMMDIAKNLYETPIMQQYIASLNSGQQQVVAESEEVTRARIQTADCTAKYIRKYAEGYLSRMMERIEWFPLAYHIVDKLAIPVVAVLGYFTGRYGLTDKIIFQWALAVMPVVAVTVIWAINDIPGWLRKHRKQQPLVSRGS